MGRYFEELARRFPRGFDPGDALDEAAARMNAPAGTFVLGRAGATCAAAGGIEHVDGATAEVKRMWVAPAWRGQGVARRLLAHLEGVAREAGRTQVVLDTNGTLTEALALYRACGYEPTGRYNGNPYATHWFTRAL